MLWYCRLPAGLRPSSVVSGFFSYQWSAFTVASFLCGAAPTLPILVIFRIIQGVTGGVMQPLSQAILLEAFDPADRGKAMGFWGLGIVVAPIIGPVLGGWLTDNYSWRWVFYINIPIGALSILMVRAYIFDPPYLRRTMMAIDYWGIGLLALGVGATQIMLDKGEQEDWFASTLIVALLIAGSVALVAFVIRELRTRHPVVDLRVFKHATYSMGVLLTTVLGFVLYGSLVLLPVMLQTLMGYSAVEAGLALAPRGLGSFIAMPLIGSRDGSIRSTEARRRRVAPRGLHPVLVFLAEPGGRVLGSLLAAVFPGILARAAVRPAHHGHDGGDLARGNGKCRQPVQFDAERGEQRRDCGGDDHAHAAPSVPRRNHLDARQPVLRRRRQRGVAQLQAYFISRGADAGTALQRAYAAIHGMIQREAAFLSFVDAFYLLGMIFLVMIPLLFLMRQAGTESRTDTSRHRLTKVQ